MGENTFLKQFKADKSLKADSMGNILGTMSDATIEQKLINVCQPTVVKIVAQGAKRSWRWPFTQSQTLNREWDRILSAFFLGLAVVIFL